MSIESISGKGSACGKIILIGEHFIVKHESDEGSALHENGSVPALALPLKNIYCEVKIKLAEHPSYIFSTAKNQKPALDVDTVEVENLMARATYIAADCFRIDPKAHPMQVQSNTNFPLSRGFGSSASFAVALTRAFDEYRKNLIGSSATLEELQHSMYSIEKVFHGKPSGLDTTVVFSERPIRFQDGKLVREFSNNTVDFIVIDSGFRENCSELVSQVADFRKRNPDQWKKMAMVTANLTDMLESELKDGTVAKVASFVKDAHGILSELGLSNAEVESSIQEAIDCGALSGKVSGAGGGGAVLLVVPLSKGNEIAKTLSTKGYSVISVLEGAKNQ